MNILMICTGNTCRSPMAQALLQKKCDERNLDVYVSSAGIATLNGLLASNNAVLAIGEMECDISLHTSREITSADIVSADLILTMTNAQRDALKVGVNVDKNKIFTIGEFIGEPENEICDPFGEDIEVYRECAMQLDEMLEEVADMVEDEYDV
ncbi:MAG: low molecular weight protein arginine phosphatase [Eubacteriales bacterium]|nr:low molecular weight protein arginine phosphatase [Eubacteriales bacterium]